MACDEFLVEKAIRGDQEAFLTLMNTCKIDLFRTALSFLKNDTEAVEAVQEVTYRAYKHIKKLKEPAYFKTWLMRIMINYCQDQLKKQKRVMSDEVFLQALAIQESTTRLELEDAIAGLDDRSREVIMLKYFHDLKIKDIAVVMQCPEGTVKTWLNKALKALRQQLSEEGADSNVS